VADSETHRAINAIFRSETPRLIAALTRMLKDVGLAEEIAQDALVAALETWPATGVPDVPGAWLRTAAKNRALNHFRRGKMLDGKHAQIQHQLESSSGSGENQVESELANMIDEDVHDDLLRLMFTACHPVLSTEARVALTLRLLGGLTTEEIARAFLVSEGTISQRLVRAKRTLLEKQIPFEVPRGEELGERLRSVLEVIYLIFNEGYSATVGEDLIRADLCREAIRLGEVLSDLAVSEPEVHGLLALMELNESRSRARTTAEGEPVLLLDQDRSLWDRTLLDKGLEALERAQALGERRGPYTLQAAISACHARARDAGATDWPEIVRLYASLLELVPSPVIALNHAVAVSMAEGPERGLELVDELMKEPSLASYPFLPAARAELLEKLARFDQARHEFERAAELAKNARQRERLISRARALDRKN
jgi:RNA polymerase sigma-70 factor, ECF subfamily